MESNQDVYRSRQKSETRRNDICCRPELEEEEGTIYPFLSLECRCICRASSQKPFIICGEVKPATYSSHPFYLFQPT